MILAALLFSLAGLSAALYAIFRSVYIGTRRLPEESLSDGTYTLRKIGPGLYEIESKDE